MNYEQYELGYQLCDDNELNEKLYNNIFNIPVIMYIIENNYINLLKLIIKESKLKTRKSIPKRRYVDIAVISIIYGKIKFLKYAFKNNCELNEQMFLKAVQYGKLDCLKYLVKKQLSEKKQSLNNKYLSNDQELNDQKLNDQKLNDQELNGGQLLNVKIKWPKQICYKAAEYGHIDCLEYVHKNGAKISNETASIAFINHNFECLLYVYKNGCPFETYLDERGSIKKLVYRTFNISEAYIYNHIDTNAQKCFMYAFYNKFSFIDPNLPKYIFKNLHHKQLLIDKQNVSNNLYFKYICKDINDIIKYYISPIN